MSRTETELGFALGEPSSTQLAEDCPVPGIPEDAACMMLAWSYGAPLLGRDKSSTVKGRVFAPSLRDGAREPVARIW